MSARTLCAVATAALFTSGVQAQLDDLLIVDLSVPNQITITATAGLSAVTTSGSDTVGVYMENFYSAAGGSLSVSSTGAGDLTNAENPSDGSPSLFRAGSGSDTGLNVWSFSSDTTVTFTAGSLAFIGSGTWALDAPEYADMLANTGSGNLYFPADDASDLTSAVLLGRWRVIPAPGAATIFGMGLIGAARRRR
ncbi:MAG: hypothetical protein KDA31_06430 [Phycisphaerales bacterium]|nr:hypothetical protein [Phycisphaerales bacterium]MCB9836492.1 hypothetical protein [Phycisphaera sp.]